MHSSSRGLFCASLIASVLSFASSASAAYAQQPDEAAPAPAAAASAPVAPAADPAQAAVPVVAADAAEPVPATPLVPAVKPWLLDLDTAFFSQSRDVGTLSRTTLSYTITSFVLGGTYRADHFELEMAIPFAHGTSSFTESSESVGDNSRSATSFGNPLIGAYYAENHSFGRLRIGASVTLPLAPNSGGDQGELFGAVYTRSLERAGMWVPQRISIAPSIRLANDEHQGVQHVSELVIAPLISTTSAQSSDLLVQASQSIGYRTGPLRFGVRGMLVAIPTAAGSDKAQFSVMPYVGGDFGTGFVDLGLNMNIDEPFGPLFDQGAFWAVKLRVGARF